MQKSPENSADESASSAASSGRKGLVKPPGGSGSHSSIASSGSKGLVQPPGGSDSHLSLASSGIKGLAQPPGGSGSHLSLASGTKELAQPPGGGDSHESLTSGTKGLAQPPGGSGSNLSLTSGTKELAQPPGGGDSHLSLTSSGTKRQSKAITESKDPRGGSGSNASEVSHNEKLPLPLNSDVGSGGSGSLKSFGAKRSQGSNSSRSQTSAGLGGPPQASGGSQQVDLGLREDMPAVVGSTEYKVEDASSFAGKEEETSRSPTSPTSVIASSVVSGTSAQPKKKALAALMKGLKSGAVAKIVDDMEATAEVPPKEPTEPAQLQYSEKANADPDTLEDDMPTGEDHILDQLDRIEQVCASSGLLYSLSALNLNRVVGALQSKGPKVVKKGEVVIREGESVSSNDPGLFIFERGRLNIFRAEDGVPFPGNQVFTIEHPGHSFGEVALLDDCPRTATVIAAAQSLLWCVDRRMFNLCVKEALLERRHRLVQYLKSVELLKDLSLSERQKLAKVMYSRTFRPGDRIIKQGEEGREFFLVETGSAYTSIQGSKVKEYGPGDYFGELAMIERQPRAADAFASSNPTVVAVLDAESFERLLGKLTDLMNARSRFLSSEPSLHTYDTTSVYDATYGSDDAEGTEIDEDDEVGEMDEEEFSRQCKIMEQQGPLRRKAISSESLDSKHSWKPEKHPKTDAQFDEILSAISKSVVFDSLHPEDLRQITHAFKGPMKVVRGAAIIQEGHRPDFHDPGLFLLEKGALQVKKRRHSDSARDDVVGAIDKPWSSFGELALLHECPRTATVIARVDSLLWTLDRETFQNCVILAKQRHKEARIRFLESIDLFRGLTADERLKLCEVMQTRHYHAGETIIAQGEKGTEFFLMEEGAAHAVVDGSRVKDYRPYDFFGELALIHQQPRIASVIADRTPTVCAILGANRFRRLLGNFQDIMNQRSREYEVSPRSQALEDQDDEIESDMDEAEFQRQEAIMRSHRLRGRGAIFSEKWIPKEGWAHPYYHKTPIQFDLIQQTCLKSFLFQNLVGENLKQVVDAFKGPQRLPAGKQIAHQGTRVHSNDQALYVLEKGSLDVFRAGEGENRPGSFVTTLNRVGSAFGEVHLVENCPRTATVQARTDSIVWSIDRDTFTHLVKSFNVSVWQKHERFLASVELFRNISAEERGKLVDAIQLRTYNRGHFIIRKGDMGTEFFVLQEGSAIALINGQRVREYGPSQYFGELALMFRQPRSADVIASAHPTVVAVLTSSAFTRILGNLQTLMAERANLYTIPLGGVASWIVPKRDVGPEWICNAKRCNFRNFGRKNYCLKCGQHRPSSNQSQAIVPYQALQVQVLAQASESRPDLFGAVPAVTHALELSGVDPGQTNVFFAKYPRRLSDVGIAQGTYPMVPGEFFQVTIQCLGTFGEISVGLAPSAKLAPGGGGPEWLKKRYSSGWSKDFKPGPAEPAAPRGTSMVGWGVREIAFMGDHGIWCFRGRLPGPKVSEPWEQGDVIECGMDESGGLYMKRNGERVDKNKEGTGPLGTDEYWPAEDSYPTVTFHSSGAEVLLNLQHISRKPEPRAAYDLPPAEAAKKLLNTLRRTVIPGRYSSSFWSWCNCSDVQIRRPETISSPGRSGTGTASPIPTSP